MNPSLPLLFPKTTTNEQFLIINIHPRRRETTSHHGNLIGNAISIQQKAAMNWSITSGNNNQLVLPAIVNRAADAASLLPSFLLFNCQPR